MYCRLAVSLLDIGCARVAIGQGAIPPSIEDCRRQIEHLEVEIGGARNVDHILTRSLLPEISQEILTRMAQGLPPCHGLTSPSPISASSSTVSSEQRRG